MLNTENPTPPPTGLGMPTDTAPFRLTESAERRLTKLLTGEPEGSLLRVSVLGGGCSGFQYRFDFEAAPAAADDFMIHAGPVTVAVDATSLEFLKGSALDYVETLGGSAFEIRNPNTTSSCGCGNSFSVV